MVVARMVDVCPCILKETLGFESILLLWTLLDFMFDGPLLGFVYELCLIFVSFLYFWALAFFYKINKVKKRKTKLISNE